MQIPPKNSREKIEINPLINDYNESRLDYNKRPYSPGIEITSSQDFDDLLEKYRAFFGAPDAYRFPVDEELIEAYCIWDFSESLVLQLEEKYPAKIRKYSSYSKKKLNPLKTKHLTNKADFYYSIGIIYSSANYDDRIQNSYLNLFKNVLKIKRAWGVYARFLVKMSFTDFLKKEITAKYPSRVHFTEKIIPLFEILRSDALNLAKLINEPYEAKKDPARRLKISQDANKVRHRGKSDLIRNYINFFSEFIIGEEFEEEHRGRQYYRKEKYGNLSKFFADHSDYLYLILNNYKEFARRNSYNYGVDLIDENLPRIFMKWLKEDRNFASAIERICTFRLKSANNQKSINSSLDL